MASKILLEKPKSVFSAKDKSTLLSLIISFSEHERQKITDNKNICSLIFKVNK